MDNNIINNINLSQIPTEELLKELELRGYKVPALKKITSKSLSQSSKPQTSAKQISLNIDCKKIFDEKNQQELISLLNNYTKQEINEFYNQITSKITKLSGSKSDYIDAIIGIKRAMGAGKAFAKWS